MKLKRMPKPASHGCCLCCCSPDFDNSLLRKFLNWCATRLQSLAWIGNPKSSGADQVLDDALLAELAVPPGMSAPSMVAVRGVFLGTGILMTLVEIAKLGHREVRLMSRLAKIVLSCANRTLCWTEHGCMKRAVGRNTVRRATCVVRPTNPRSTRNLPAIMNCCVGITRFCKRRYPWCSCESST